MINGAKIEKFLFSLLIIFLPTQLGRHFWPQFSIVSGIRIDYLSPTVYFTDTLVLLLFALWLFRKLQIQNFKSQINYNNKKKRAQNVLNFGVFNLRFIWSLVLSIWNFKSTYFFFLLFLVINIVLSHNILNGYYHLLKFLECSFVAYYIANTMHKKQQIVQLASLCSVGIIFESLLAFLQYATQGSIGGPLYFLGERSFLSQTPGIANASINGQLLLRPYGTFSHPNVLAGYLVIALTLIVFSATSLQAKKAKILFFSAFTIGTLALFSTLSRTAIVLWVVYLVIVFLSRLRKQAHAKELLAGFVGALIVSCLFLTPLFYRFSQTKTSEESFVQRDALLTAAAQMIADKPIWGVGLGNFLPILSVIQKPLSLGMYLQPVHNIFLLVAAELGVVGFIFFIWFLYKTYERLRYSPLHSTAGFMLSAILFLGFFDHYFLTIQQGQLLFAVVVGLCWSGLNTLSNVTSSKTPS